MYKEASCLVSVASFLIIKQPFPSDGRYSFKLFDLKKLEIREGSTHAILDFCKGLEEDSRWGGGIKKGRVVEM